jgi:hypothetical protein
MTHIDEHRLELYLLDPEALGAGISEVEIHLKDCPGCYAIVEQMRSFYTQAEQTFTEGKVRAVGTPGTSLIPLEEQMPDIFAAPDRLVKRQWSVDRKPVFGLVRRHPVVAGSGAFALLAVVAATAFFFVRGAKDVNPAYAHLNPAAETIEIFNARNEICWTLPAQNLRDVADLENRTQLRAIQVIDLDGDGANEVVTIAKLGIDPKQTAAPLRIIDHYGGELYRIPLGGAVKYAGIEYGEEYKPLGIAVAAPGADGRREIIAGANTVRSPYVITRVSPSGKVLGEYWHFGSIYGFSVLSVGAKEAIVAWGTNDVPDTSGRSDSSFAFIAVLDPAKIQGRTESAFTRGFGFPVSDAEVHYIRLPRSDIQDALHLPSATTSMDVERDTVLTFGVSSPSKSGESSTFYYSFTTTLRPLLVKSDDITEADHRKLVSQGKLKSRWDQEYFQKLKSNIQFLR